MTLALGEINGASLAAAEVTHCPTSRGAAEVRTPKSVKLTGVIVVVLNLQ